MFTLTVNGAGFSNTASVRWNGSPRITEVISSSTLQARISADDVKQAQTAAITVANPGAKHEVSNVVYLPIRIRSKSVSVEKRAIRGNSTGIAIGDFNNDGKLDVVVGRTKNYSEFWVDTYLGNGDGTFRKPLRTTTLINYRSMLVGDFNNDGKIDILGTDFDYDTNVLLGSGDGTFTERRAGGAFPIAVADFNGDGILDAIMGDPYEDYIYLGNGDGTFTYFGFFDLTLGAPAIGDFNGDGILDVALPNGYELVVYLGNGDGSFQQGASYQSNCVGYQAVAADVNGDGKLDLIASGGAVLLGNGDGSFQVGNCLSVPGYNVQVGDLNGDGKLDVALLSSFYNGTAVYVLFGDGQGNFNNPEMLFGTSGDSSTYLGIGDFNDDGKLDLILNTADIVGPKWPLILLQSKR